MQILSFPLGMGIKGNYGNDLALLQSLFPSLSTPHRHRHGSLEHSNGQPNCRSESRCPTESEGPRECAAPEVEPRQRRGAPLQVPRSPHSQLPIPGHHQLLNSPREDGAVLIAAVEGRERRDPLQRVRKGGPARDAQLVPA
jgi:hypothetical protein